MRLTAIIAHPNAAESWAGRHHPPACYAWGEALTERQCGLHGHRYAPLGSRLVRF